MTWMQTNTGRKWDLLHPERTPVDFREIAHSLAALPRFTNHTRVPYSVAEHCCRVSDFLPEPYRLAGLLHDAHEAYTGDIGTPMQVALIEQADREIFGGGSAFKLALSRIKDKHDAHIYRTAGLTWPLTPEAHAAIKAADCVMLMTERRDQLGPSPEPWGEYENFEPAAVSLRRPWTRLQAYQRFLGRLKALGVRNGL